MSEYKEKAAERQVGKCGKSSQIADLCMYRIYWISGGEEWYE